MSQRLLPEYGQKAWKPDCGIETSVGYSERSQARCQKAWKPDCGIETGETTVMPTVLELSEGLEARLRD